VELEKFTDKAHVSAPGELHFFGAVMQVEFRRKRFSERLRSGVPRVDERAVNVEENEPDHAKKYQGRRVPARFLNRIKAQKNICQLSGGCGK
jgi:hypothetical protein